MKVDYEGTEYELDFDEVTVKQAKAVKNSTGLTLQGLEDGLSSGDPDALRALFWLMQVTSGIKSNIEEVDFKLVKFSKAVQVAVEKQVADEEAEEAAKVKKAEAASAKRKAAAAAS